MPFEAYLLFALLFGLLSSDKVSGLLSEISSPIILNTLLGLFLQHFYGINNAAIYGLSIGIAYSLFWLSHLPVGAYLPPNNNFSAAFSLLLFAVLPGKNFIAKMAYSIAFGLPTAFVASYVEIFFRNINGILKKMVEHGVNNGRFYMIFVGILSGLFIYFLWSASVLLIIFLSVKGILSLIFSKIMYFTWIRQFFVLLVFFSMIYGLVKSYLLFTYRRLSYIFWAAQFIGLAFFFKFYALALILSVVLLIDKLFLEKSIEKS